MISAQNRFYRYNQAGRISVVNGQQSGEAAKTYASQFAYYPHGAVRAMQLGTQVTEETIYDVGRLQPLLIKLTHLTTNHSLLELHYNYRNNAPEQRSNNNGNVLHHTSVVDGVVRQQVYEYDELNRLKKGVEVNSNGALHWEQNFVYDRYGNRRFGAGTTTIGSVTDPRDNPTIDPSNNRLTVGQGAIAYDLAGNLKHDYDGHAFAYDAENRQTSYDNGAASYSYDGDGRRVKKMAGSEVTIFVYDASGQLVAEYSNAAPEAGSGGTSYLTNDALGTPRVITDSNGAVKSRHDYLPFGEEISVGVGGRTTGQKYLYGVGDDGVRQKFTQKERDIETGLDWFGPGRYYSSTQGRFTSVDPNGAGAKAANPQSFNGYAYTLNRPTIAIDPDGLSTIIVTVTAPAGGGNPTSTTQLYDQQGMVRGARYRGLAAGQDRDRRVRNGDTPYGVYRADRGLVTQGGSADSRLGVGYGTGKVRFDAIAGEAFDSGVSDIRIHGGGTGLPDPYTPYQDLIPTQGCIRVANADVNALIGDINSLAERDDPLNRVFVGTEDGLRDLANQTDSSGNYLYADLRLSLGIYQNEEQRNQLIEQDRQRRQNQANDRNPSLPGRPPRPARQRQQADRNN